MVSATAETVHRYRDLSDAILTSDGAAMTSAPWTIDDVGELRRAMVLACQHNNLTDAQWLVDEFGITAMIVQPVITHIFRRACEGGHLRMLNWVAENLNLNPRDSVIHFHFMHASYEGSPHVALWLNEKYGVGRAEDLDRVHERVNAPATCYSYSCRCPLSCAGVMWSHAATVHQY